MGKFILRPDKKEFNRLYDDAFLWNEGNIFVMANHRLALWCWLQSLKIFNKKHALIHIDKHTDARKWMAEGEPKCLKSAIVNFENLVTLDNYNNLQCVHRDCDLDNRKMRPCITWDNFIYLSAKAQLFDHYYIYSSTGDWYTELPKEKFNEYKDISDIETLASNIQSYENKCIVDIDLDFFDSDSQAEESLLHYVFKTILEYKSVISMITIAINDTPGNHLWNKRQEQMVIIKDILNMEISTPISTIF